MSLQDYKEAKRIIDQHPEMLDFVGPRSEAIVEEAENALQVKFPPTYRKFLLEYGAGSFGSSEVYGVISNNFEESSVPDAIWCTLNLRIQIDFPRNLVAIQNDGTGNFLCLDCKPNANVEFPVILYLLGYDSKEEQYEVIAKDFGSLLLQLVQNEVP